MENFCISYKVERDDRERKIYTDFRGLTPYQVSSSFDPEEELKHYLSQVKEIKEVIVDDFKRILENRIKELDDNFELTEQIVYLIGSYLDDVEDTIYETRNFIVLTDEYLCFNNIEVGYDEINGKLDFDSEEAETIVIVNRKYTKFYFITRVSNVINEDSVYDIEAYELEDKKVKSSHVRFAGEINIPEINEELADSLLSTVKVIKELKR